MTHSTSGELTAHREQWFREIEEGLLWHVKDVTALRKDRLRDDIGEPRLIGSLLVARIAVQLARGESAANIRDMLASCPVFAAPSPDIDELTELIAKVQFGLEHDGLGNSVAVLDGLGLFPWSPESTYMLLIEYWAAQRGRTVPRTRVERELGELWDIADSRVLAAHSSLPACPLETYPDVWEKLKAEPDFRVGNAGAMMLTQHGGGDRAWEQWMSTRPWSPLKCRHLVSLGGDLVRCQAAQRALNRLLDQAPSGDEFRTVLERAARIIDEQLSRIALAVEGMSAIEYELLRERTSEEHFQDGCLATFQEHLLKRYQTYSPFPEHETKHGTWGPLPWWSIALHDEREQQAAEELLVRRGMQLRITAKNQDADELEIICQEPGLGPSGLTARLHFDLRNAVHACELLLLARRQSVAVDFLTEHIDEWDDREVNLIGTLDIAIGSDISATLADISTRALRRLMPGASGPAFYAEGVPALERLLNSSPLPEICRHPR
ncbi:hypothetical protein LK07_24190 [Streptomyces pluripotens]|uniref:Uncharacterized protein n=1 Tax=Streptomyces pluripotens TaxID=1355015 RepID=A0A221P3G8_9ACTN|nr:hypothetical protein [Streptomyces pluripotens]ARP72347.1 hypothetical protein LK06_023025 [Streptomyces pluripotens]ASN26598.1 hypothetical protein LK07_24190 [Streptomyces pluripotens]